MRDIVAGPYHSAAITVSGRVYMWGCNTNHQLGRDDFEDNEVGLLNFNHGNIVQVSIDYVYLMLVIILVFIRKGFKMAYSMVIS